MHLARYASRRSGEPRTERGRDYLGRTVNTAPRIAAYARSGEVLVSDAVLHAADLAGCEFEPIGPAELKGVHASEAGQRADVALSGELDDFTKPGDRRLSETIGA